MLGAKKCLPKCHPWQPLGINLVSAGPKLCSSGTLREGAAMVAFLRPLDSKTFHISYSLLRPGLCLLEEEASALVLELEGAWGLSQLVWGMIYPLLSASGKGYSSPSEWHFQKGQQGRCSGSPVYFQFLQHLQPHHHQAPSRPSPPGLWLSLPLGKGDPGRFGKHCLQRRLAPCPGRQGYI